MKPWKSRHAVVAEPIAARASARAVRISAAYSGIVSTFLSTIQAPQVSICRTTSAGARSRPGTSSGRLVGLELAGIVLDPVAIEPAGERRQRIQGEERVVGKLVTDAERLGRKGRCRVLVDRDEAHGCVFLVAVRRLQARPERPRRGAGGDLSLESGEPDAVERAAADRADNQRAESPCDRARGRRSSDDWPRRRNRCALIAGSAKRLSAASSITWAPGEKRAKRSSWAIFQV